MSTFEEAVINARRMRHCRRASWCEGFYLAIDTQKYRWTSYVKINKDSLCIFALTNDDRKATDWVIE